MARSNSPENYLVRAVIQSRNFADFDLHISAGMGFRQ